MKIQLFCKCGAGAEGVIEGLQSAAEKFRKLWYKTHSGPGHEDCDRETARRAMRKEEAEKE